MTDVTLVSVSISNPRTIPVGPLYVAAVLYREGYSVAFRNHTVGSYADLNPDTLVSYLDDSARVIAVSCMSDCLPFVITALRALKQREPDKIVVLGGAGPTGVARELLESFEFVDIVVVGEGEATILEVMECVTRGTISDLALVKGICYRDREEVCVNGPRERIRDLDCLPFPSYESIAMEDYPLANIVFSRGCPYMCSFCDVAPMWGRKNYRRDVDSVIDEIKFLRNKYGKTDFEFTDETFVVNRDGVSEFCERLGQQDINIKWACTGRINLITRDLLAEMKAAGCKAIFYGVESGSDVVLDRVRKDLSVQQAVDVIHMTVDYMRVVASFIWGFPFETIKDLLQTLFVMVYMSQIGVDTRLNRLAPFALTPLYGEYGHNLKWFEQQGPFSPIDPFQCQYVGEEIRTLVAKFPNVFPEFYWFPSEQLAEKSELVRALDRHWRVADWPDTSDLGSRVCRASEPVQGINGVC